MGLQDLRRDSYICSQVCCSKQRKYDQGELAKFEATRNGQQPVPKTVIDCLE